LVGRNSGSGDRCGCGGDRFAGWRRRFRRLQPACPSDCARGHPDVTPPLDPRATKAPGSSIPAAPTVTPSPAFLFESGEAFIRNGDLERAIEEFSTAIALIPTYGYGYSGRGNAQYQIGEYQKAIADFDQSIILDPRLASALKRRGLAYRQLEEFESAKQDIDAACSLDSQF